MAWWVAIPIIASAISQWYNSEQSRNASKSDRDAMEELFGKLQDPDFDTSLITPEEFSVVSNYIPEAAQPIAEAEPTLVQKTAVWQQGEGAQQKALGRLMGISEQEEDPAMTAAMNIAQRKTMGEAQSRADAIKSQMERRGAGGSGVNAMLQMEAQSGAMDRLGEMTQDEAAKSYQNRINAMMESGRLGGQMAEREMSLGRTNADIINAFSARTAAAARENQARNVAARNEAAKIQAENAQEIANRNVLGGNAAQIEQRRSKNEQAQQKFRNQYDITSGKLGLGRKGIAARTQDTQAQNQAIQGLTGDIGDWLNYEQGRENTSAKERRADQRAASGQYFEKYGKSPTKKELDEMIQYSNY